jgi:hypothetical protein
LSRLTLLCRVLAHREMLPHPKNRSQSGYGSPRDGLSPLRNHHLATRLVISLVVLFIEPNGGRIRCLNLSCDLALRDGFLEQLNPSCGLKSLRNYRKEWDEDRATFRATT